MPSGSNTLGLLLALTWVTPLEGLSLSEVAAGARSELGTPKAGGGTATEGDRPVGGNAGGNPSAEGNTATLGSASDPLASNGISTAPGSSGGIALGGGTLANAAGSGLDGVARTNPLDAGCVSKRFAPVPTSTESS